MPKLVTAQEMFDQFLVKCPQQDQKKLMAMQALFNSGIMETIQAIQRMVLDGVNPYDLPLLFQLWTDEIEEIAKEQQVKIMEIIQNAQS